MVTEATATRQRPRLLPPVWFLMAIAAMAGLHLFAPAAVWNRWPWTLAGLIPIVLGLAVALSGNRRFRRAETTLHPFGEPSRLVTDGVFQLSRNPMYLGMLLVLAGVAIVLSSATPLAVLPSFYALIRLRFVRHEEQALERRFGPAYHEYRRQVRRWL